MPARLDLREHTFAEYPFRRTDASQGRRYRRRMAMGIEDRLDLPDPDVTFYPRFFSVEESDRLLGELNRTTTWRQEEIETDDATIPLPRLTAWYGDPGHAYTYSKITMQPEPWTEPLQEIKTRIEVVSLTTFNSVLLNLYRDGRDSVGWHSDDEPELGEMPVIGSVSFGGTRSFVLRHKERKVPDLELTLTHGSYLLMKGTTQRFWKHRVPKTTDPVEPRINLTFRRVGGDGL
jgi:alkylated DNA repair dioxygenase AlkB